MKISGNQKYNQIITTGRQLFWKYGIKRVPIEEICREAGVSKMTFYKHFDNKLDLVRHIIDQITNEGMLKYRKIMGQEVPFREKVRKSVHLKIGRLSCVVPESLAFCFNVMLEGTELEGAKLIMDITPLIGCCNACGREFEIEDYVFACTVCHSPEIEIVSGRDLSIVEIEVE